MGIEVRETPPVFILDGGLGTTLEDLFHQDISTPLWSAKPVQDNPGVIVAAHLAFLRAGADIILTSTYQCAYNTFERSGYSRQDANRIMLKSVGLAIEAKRQHLEEQAHIGDKSDHTQQSSRRDVKIALSLGPYGATLSPAHEFDGIYPPPYGPDPEKTNGFDDTDLGRAQEQAAVYALTTFHYERLKVYADDAQCWDALDFVAFETVPLRREILAIRKAVARLVDVMASERRTWKMKPWWISTVHPFGRFPEMKAGGRRVSMSEVVSAILQEREDGTLASPWGMGINCTGVEFLSSLLQEAQTTKDTVMGTRERKPWLVLYSNRGDTYDTQTQTWTTRDGQGREWAEDMGSIVLECVRTGSWGGIVAGGCCKTGPEEISWLAKLVQNTTEV